MASLWLHYSPSSEQSGERFVTSKPLGPVNMASWSGNSLCKISVRRRNCSSVCLWLRSRSICNCRCCSVFDKCWLEAVKWHNFLIAINVQSEMLGVSLKLLTLVDICCPSVLLVAQAIATYTVFDRAHQGHHCWGFKCSTDEMLQRTTINKHTRQSKICYSYCA